MAQWISTNQQCFSPSTVPGLAVLSSAATGCRRRTRFPFGESCECCQVRAGSRQVGTAALLLLPAALGTAAGHSVGPDQYPVPGVTVEVVLAAH